MRQWQINKLVCKIRTCRDKVTRKGKGKKKKKKKEADRNTVFETKLFFSFVVFFFFNLDTQ